jgi:hypothetical protein
VFAASDATEAAVMDFSDYNLTGYNIVSHHESNFTSSKEIIGTLKSTVYKKDSIYTYVLEVTPSWELQFVSDFNMELEPGEMEKNGGYGSYGYSFSQAKSAFGVSDGSSLFNLDLGNDNTLDWDVNGNRSWLPGQTITFFYENSGFPEMGTYKLKFVKDANADGYVPGATPVPIPGSIIMLGSCIFGLLKIRKIYQNGLFY